jgi:hypothetical protein
LNFLLILEEGGHPLYRLFEREQYIFPHWNYRVLSWGIDHYAADSHRISRIGLCRTV